jgi:hypothetical protein
VKPAHDGSFRAAQDFTDLLVGETLYRSQYDDGLVFGVKSFTAETSFLLALDHEHPKMGEPCRFAPQQFVHRITEIQRVSLLPSLRVNRYIDGDAVEPGIEGRAALKTLDFL